MPADVWLVVLAVVLTFLAGLLASVDAALSAFSPARADELVREHRGGAVRLRRVLEDPAPAISAVLLLRILAETTAVVLVAVVVVDAFARPWLGLVVAALLMTVVAYVAIGVGPRTLGLQKSEQVALASAGLVSAATTVLTPATRLLILVGNAFTPGQGMREGPFASEAELRELVDRAAASMLIESGESRMIHSVFELGDTRVREVMVPRTDIVFIESGKTLRQAMSLALRSGYSRIPVTGDGIDDIVGMLYLKDATRRVFDDREVESVERVEACVRPCVYVPDSKPVDGLLREMQAQRTHVAVVVDEYGGTAGLVTIEDIVEEIVGEITDEYDAPPDVVERLEDGRFRLSARFEVDDLEEVVGVPFEDDDVDSVGGLLAKHLGKVPIPGSMVEIDGVRFEAEATAGRRNRIGTVLVSRAEEPGDDASIRWGHAAADQR